MANAQSLAGTYLKTNCFKILKGNNTKVGLNALANRLHVLNGRIPLAWLNLSVNTYKVKCKALLF